MGGVVSAFEGAGDFIEENNAYAYFLGKANDMARAQELAYTKAMGTLRDAYQTYGQPYFDQGMDAQGLMGDYLGLGGVDAQREAFEAYQYSPGAEFAIEQGTRLIDQDAAASGGLLGGDRLKALQEYGTGMYLQDFGNQYNRLGGIAAQGQQAANQGLMTEAQVAQLQASIGDAYAGATGLAGQNWFQGWAGVNDTYSTIMGGMGGFMGG